MAMRGAWLASTPIEPVVVRVETISTSSSKTLPSGVRTSTGKLFLAIAFLFGALRLLDRHVLALGAGERLRHEERLRQEALHLAGALHGHAVLVRQLVDPEDRDDVLQLLVP